MIRLKFDEELFNILWCWQKAHLKRLLRKNEDFHPWEEEIQSVRLGEWLLSKIGEEAIAQYFDAREEAEKEIAEEIEEGKLRSKRRELEKEQRRGKQFCTYLIKNHRNGYFKIGRSKNPKQREATLQAEEPEVELIASTKKDIEPLLHNLFSDHRIRGEWFELDEEQISKIVSMFTEETVQ